MQHTALLFHSNVDFFFGGISILCSPSVPSVSLANVKLQQSVATGSVSWQLPQVGKLRKEWESWVESSRSSWRTRATRFTRHIPSLTVCVIMGQAVLKKSKQNKTKQIKTKVSFNESWSWQNPTGRDFLRNKDCSWLWSLWHDDVMMLWQLSHYHLAATQTSAALQSTTWEISTLYLDTSSGRRLHVHHRLYYTTHWNIFQVLGLTCLISSTWTNLQTVNFFF